MLKRRELPNGFQGRVLKDSMRGRVSGYTISLDTVLSLVDGEVTGWYFGNLNNHTSGSIQWSACSSLLLLVGVLVSAKQLGNVHQTLIYGFQRGSEDSVTAIWLICDVNCDLLSRTN